VNEVIHRARTVRTLDPALPVAEEAAVRDGRILGVGSVAELGSTWGELPVDETFADAVLLPGFVEARPRRGGVGMGVRRLLPAPRAGPRDPGGVPELR
jgi:hypothetical protein